MIRKICASRILVALLFAFASLARAEYITSYTLDLDSEQPVTNIMLLEEGADFTSGTWPLSTNEGEITNPFPLPGMPLRSLLMGIVQNLPGDTEGQKHIALFIDAQTATFALDNRWETLFPQTSEDQLILDLELIGSGQPYSTILPGLNGVQTFSQGDAKTGIRDGAGRFRSAWFRPGENFSIVVFSTGQLLGTGTSRAIISAEASIPEPATAILMMLGAIAILGLRRRH